MELEENREIPFLDVCIKRDHNTFSTTIHHKKTFTGLYTKWDSFTPKKYKVNLIRTLTYRCLRICSKSTLLQSALSDLKNSLLQNGYPKGVINYNVNDLLHKHKNKPVTIRHCYSANQSQAFPCARCCCSVPHNMAVVLLLE